MKTLLPLLLVLLTLATATSCKKWLDKKKEEMALSIMTGGDWYVEEYLEDSVNITSGFADYLFRFKEDRTVTGTRGAEVHSGTWQEVVSSLSIVSEFPTAPDPLQKLNGTWKFKDSSREFVKAEMTTATGKNRLFLRKKQ